MAETEDLATSAKQTYDKLSDNRRPYLTRARDVALLTVPFLMPPEGSTSSTKFVTPSQSLGSRGLRHLAAKLTNSLFPINQPFFRNKVDDISLEKLKEDTQLETGTIQKALAFRERATMDELNSSMFRPVAFECARQLLLAGNYLLHIPKDNKPRGFRLDSYVVDRDGSGNILDIVVLEKIARVNLSPEIRAAITTEGDTTEGTRDKDLELYTHIRRTEDGYEAYQEVSGVRVGEARTYPLDGLEWVPVRISYVEGEDYGRSYVDEYAGDLATLEALSAALRDGTAQGAKVVWLVKPGAATRPEKLSRAENGAFVTGNPDDVVALRLDKAHDFGVAERYIAQLSERLAYAFLLHSAVQRNGERVTAEEIRFMASELDQALGGVYSLLSEELQGPVANLFQKRMEKRRKVAPLPAGVSQVSIVTGMEALGRGNDLQNLDSLIAGAMQTLGGETVATYLNIEEYFTRRAVALSIDTDGLIRTRDEIMAEQQQQQQAAMMQQATGPAVNQLGAVAKEAMAQENSGE